MSWSKVGDWLKTNAGSGAALVGSLLTGNVPGAVAAGVALVGSATGHATPDEALAAFQTDPTTLIRLKELAYENEASIRAHIQAMEEMRLKDDQASHEQTQLTIRSGDNAEDVVVKRTRPLQSWASLVMAFVYIGWREYANREVEVEIVLLLLTLPWAYAGLRQIGKGMDSFTSMRKPK